jgi:hypothetical protein
MESDIEKMDQLSNLQTGANIGTKMENDIERMGPPSNGQVDVRNGG